MLERIRHAWRSEPGPLWTLLTLGAAVAWTWAVWVSVLVTTTTDDPYAGLALLLTVPLGTLTFLWLLAHWRRTSRHWDDAPPGRQRTWAGIVAVPVVVGSIWGGIETANGVHDLRVDRAIDGAMTDLLALEDRLLQDVRRDGDGQEVQAATQAIYQPVDGRLREDLVAGLARGGFDRAALVDRDADGEVDAIQAHQPGTVAFCADIGLGGAYLATLASDAAWEVGGSACDGTIVATWQV